MEIPDTFFAIPAGSIGLLEEQKQADYLDKLYTISPSLLKIATSADSGAYIRGIVKEYDLRPDCFPYISFGVLEILLGKKNLSQFSVTLSAKLGISHSQAQKISQDIQKNLLGTVQKELLQYQPMKEKDLPKSQQYIQKKALEENPNMVNLKTPMPKPPQLPQ